MSNLKPGWKAVHIAQIADHYLGKMLDKQKNKGELKPYLRNLNVRWFDFDLSDVLEMRFEKDEAERYQAQKGDLIVCEGGYPGRASIWESDEPIYLQKALHRVRFHEPDHAKWVLYWLSLRDMDGSLADSFSGTGIQHFTKAALARFVVPLPPLNELKRIVAVLDQAFAALDRARAHAEANRESSRELFGTLLEVTLWRNASNWERRSLKSLGTTQTGTTPKASEAESYGNFIPFIKPGDFKLDGSLELENQGLSALGAKRARTVPAGSALMVCIGATIGKAGFTEAEIVTNQQVNSIFPRDGISGEFLYYQFITPSFQKEVMRRSGQATLPIINKSKWSDIEVAVPSDLTTQLRIVETLREIRRHTERLVAKYDQKLIDIANLRQSLLQHAFSGRL